MTSTPAAESNRTRAWLLVILTLALLVAIVAGGYLIFRAFVTGAVPDVGAYNLLALSIIAGVASFFSPCAFPLLPGYLSLYYRETAASHQSPLKLGGAAALGVTTFNLILGVLIGLLGAGIAQGLSITGSNAAFVRLFRGLVGVGLIILGLAQLQAVNIKPTLADALAWHTRPRRDQASQHPTRSLFLYGLGYNAAGMGCTGPILTGLVLASLGEGGLPTALSAFLVFSATMGGLMLLVSVLVAASQDALIRRLKAATPRIKTVSGLLLVAVGAFNILTSIDVATFVRLLFP